MVSLGAVEELALRAWPNAEHAAVALPDAQKGEQLVLLTTRADANRAELLGRAKADGLGELHVPKKILTLAKLPLLGSGKTDYAAAQRVAAGEPPA